MVCGAQVPALKTLKFFLKSIEALMKCKSCVLAFTAVQSPSEVILNVLLIKALSYKEQVFLVTYLYPVDTIKSLQSGQYCSILLR